MTTGMLLGVLLGLSLGLVGPRAGRTLLVALAGLLAAAVLSGVAGARGWSFLGAGLVMVLALTAVVFAVERRPRIGLVLALIVALGLGVLPAMSGTGSRPGAGAIAVGVVCLGLAGWGLVRPSLGLRLACAWAAARVVLWALPVETALWQWPVLALVLLGAGRLTAPRVGLHRAPSQVAVRTAGASAVLAAGLLTLVALFTPELPPVQASFAARRAALREVAPRGGYLWPELSETVAWPDASGYRTWDNLDVRYLGGGADRGIHRVPGSARLLGRFSLNREVERMRGVKDAAELADLRAAAGAIVTAVRQTAPGRLPGVTERAIAEAIRIRARAAGCTEDSFPPVVAAGPRAASIHAAPTDAPVAAGQMVMVDVGCSVNHYASDFTRTFPVGGRFGPEHRRAYEAVYAAQQAALAACRPGAIISGRAPDGGPSLDEVAHQVLRDRLGERGYAHGLGHGVGLFVHDVGTRGPLAPGMVLTIEPGLYLPGRLGIRIEDTYRVTETGCEQLTVGLSAEPDALEAFLGGVPGG